MTARLSSLWLIKNKTDRFSVDHGRDLSACTFRSPAREKYFRQSRAFATGEEDGSHKGSLSFFLREMHLFFFTSDPFPVPP